MTNQPKSISYFSRDVDITCDTRIRKVMRKHGGLALAVYEEILALIYKSGSYYIHWNEDYILDIADSLYERDAEPIKEIFTSLIESELFDAEILQQYRVLTSRGIQERYTERVKSYNKKNSVKEEFEIEEYAVPAESGGIRRKPAESGGNRRNPAETGGNRRNPAETGGIRRNPAETGGIRRKPAETGGIRRKPAETGAKEKKSKVKKSTMGGDSCTLYSSAHAREDDFAPPSDVEDFDSPQEPEFDPVTEVVREWNEVFSETGREYRHFYPDAALSHNIRECWKVYSDLKTYRKVFEAARSEYESDEKFPWALGSVFAKPNTFDVLLAKSSLPPPQSKTRGAPVATAEEYEKYGWEKKTT